MTKTTQYQKEKAARGLLAILAKHAVLECNEAVEDVIRFSQGIYDRARAHEREDMNGVINDN